MSGRAWPPVDLMGNVLDSILTDGLIQSTASWVYTCPKGQSSCPAGPRRSCQSSCRLCEHSVCRFFCKYGTVGGRLCSPPHALLNSSLTATKSLRFIYDLLIDVSPKPKAHVWDTHKQAYVLRRRAGTCVGRKQMWGCRQA